MVIQKQLLFFEIFYFFTKKNYIKTFDLMGGGVGLALNLKLRNERNVNVNVNLTLTINLVRIWFPLLDVNHHLVMLT